MFDVISNLQLSVEGAHRVAAHHLQTAKFLVDTLQYLRLLELAEHLAIDHERDAVGEPCDLKLPPALLVVALILYLGWRFVELFA